MNTVKLPGITAYKSINEKDYRHQVMKEVERELESALMGADGVIREMCISLLNSGGKRIRPLMVLHSGMCFSELNYSMIKTAVAAELIHMASLVHDDIIDNSELRRGKATIYSKYGSHNAVLAGDYLFAEAFKILSSCRLIESMGYLVEAIQEMCDGEMHQAEEKFQTGVTVEEYFRRIGKKTGILISSCCRAGAAVAGAALKEIEAMREYGLNLGYAFQIVDDILDFTGDEKLLGKPTGMDLMSGNITLPVILLMEHPLYGAQVKRTIKSGRITKREFDNINKMLEMAGCIKEAYEEAEKCIARAKLSILSIRDSHSKSILLDAADMVLKRNV